MSKLVAVAKREYRETVRKKSFIVMTLLTPVLFLGMMVVPTALMSRPEGKKEVLLIDGTSVAGASLGERIAAGLRRDAPADSPGEEALVGSLSVEVVPAEDAAAAAAARLDEVREKKRDVVVAVPAGVRDGSASPTYYSRSATDLLTRERVERAINRAVLESRVQRLGVAPDEAAKLLKRVDVDAVQVTKTGSEKRGGKLDLLLAVGFGMMMIIPTLFHGQAILRGVLEEKTDRIVESLVSSMSAFDLLTGKVIGIAGVGLTQILIWGVMTTAIGASFAAPLAAMGVKSLNLVSPAKGVYFVIFYLLGYFLYACVYAAVGAAVNSEKEAQQAIFPVTMLLMVPWMLIAPILFDTDSTLATTLSLIPLYTPLTMFIRVVFGQPPFWQVALSIGLTLASIAGLFWAAARIFRVGILWYGKRPTIPEFLRWVRQP